MTNDKGLLLYMVADLMRDPSKQGAFVDSPNSIMDSYGLNDHQRATFYSMNAPLIADLIRDEFKANSPIESGMPVQPDWPAPDPQVRSFEPRTAARGSLLSLTIRGEALLPSAAVRLIPRSDEAAPVSGTVKGAAGTFREAELSATFDLSSASPGEYRVEVANGDGVPVLLSWKNGPFFSIH
jgi:hypothetical protein